MRSEEHTRKEDEQALAASAAAANSGMLVGGLMCILLVLLGRFVLNLPEISFAGWMVYFSMYAGSNIVLFRKLGDLRDLIYGILSAAVSAAFCIALVFKLVG